MHVTRKQRLSRSGLAFDQDWNVRMTGESPRLLERFDGLSTPKVSE